MLVGNGLLSVVARFGASPPSSVVVMFVMELLTGELYGPRLKATTFGRYAIAYPERITSLSVRLYASPTRGENSFQWRDCQVLAPYRSESRSARPPVTV